MSAGGDVAAGEGDFGVVLRRREIGWRLALPGRSAPVFSGSNGGTAPANCVGVVVSVVDSKV